MDVREFIVFAAAVLAIPSTSWTDGTEIGGIGGIETLLTLSWTLETTFLLISCTWAEAFLTVSLIEEVVLAMREGAFPETDFMEDVVLARRDLVLDRPDEKENLVGVLFGVVLVSVSLPSSLILLLLLPAEEDVSFDVGLVNIGFTGHNVDLSLLVDDYRFLWMITCHKNEKNQKSSLID